MLSCSRTGTGALRCETPKSKMLTAASPGQLPCLAPAEPLITDVYGNGLRTGLPNVAACPVRARSSGEIGPQPGLVDLTVAVLTAVQQDHRQPVPELGP